MKRTTTEKNIPLCLGVHYFFCGLSPENSSQLHNTFIHHISLSILAPASSSATNKVGHPATYVPGLQNEEIVPRLLSIALCATSSCYAHNAAKSAHHSNAETPWNSAAMSISFGSSLKSIKTAPWPTFSKTLA